MNTQHTPGHWSVTKHGTPEYAPQFGIYAEGQPHDLAIVTGDNSKANADFIVEACNSHEALVARVAELEAALKTCVAAIEAADELGG
jgi:hypothetical protein